MEFILKKINKNISEEDLLDDLKKVAKTLNKNSITLNDYTKNGSYNCKTVQNKFKTWNNALKQAGLDVDFIAKYSDYELFENLENVWIALGKQPTRRDMNEKVSKISSFPYTNRFNGWYNALEEFVKFINCNEIDNKEQELSDKHLISSHKTNRDINLRLRFKVMKRDNFKCCKCGSSPSTDPSIELHIDHIVPWEKGGETVENNLQTLCSKCNIGKSNIY